MPLRRKEMVGKKFGRLIVLSFAELRHFPSGNHPAAYWNCICECGKKIITSGAALRSGHTKSCGCYCKEQYLKANTKHGACAGDKPTDEWKLWHGMIGRCKHSFRGHKNYFDRDIKVCEEWLGSEGFKRFLSHLGKRPGKESSLDRIDNNKGYEPGNVRWATAKEQSANKRSGYRIERFSDIELIEELERRDYTIDGSKKFFRGVA